MSWDDEAINGSMGNDDAVLMDSWDAAGDDEPIMDSWDAEETTEKNPEPKKKETKPAAKKAVKGKGKQGGSDKVLMEIDTLDEKTRKELIKKAEMDSDLNNAADLFQGLGVAEKHPRELAMERDAERASLLKHAVMTKDTPFEQHPLISNAETKRDYQDLRKSLAAAIVPLNEKSSLNYSSSLTIDLIKDIAKPMSIESIRQTVATLNVLIKEKEKEERQARLAKVRGGTATGGAGKKKAKGKTNLGGAFKKDNDFDLDSNNYDDFGDDDFM
ncbi:similar to Saccharomyces cerevisiae YLR192C HCR1 Dual function protein [Maudiozyma barnettii]|uniref:Eukaryotic translation initiation factor 3 subunit J n=1 Tax=Maudiozyma barnettii TaxID=61262 RepID=A0A8H2VET8_9SACH|nr:translation initiation factor eIF3 core subunit j [Kazachstania barnettii]CAB4253814.1 similar to Saccharomyces cerevisiae YLR192C HCR1 Dual function protein [Kazachstania barnettii]CAD1781563.1 similar to Saccharomyces cerevisiae YLR192C HCR1 Dual function protein [Kazachstania barnettii]